MSAHTKAQLGRWLRLVIFTVVSAAVAVPAVQAAEVRYPLMGAILGALEVAYRSFYPTQPLPFVTSQPARPTETDPPTPPTKG